MGINDIIESEKLLVTNRTDKSVSYLGRIGRSYLGKIAAAGLVALALAGCNNKSDIPRHAGPLTKEQIAANIAKQEQKDGKWIYSLNSDTNGIVTNETGQKTQVMSQAKHRFYMGDNVPTVPTITYAPIEHKAYYTDTNGQLIEVRKEALDNAEFFASYTLAKHPVTGVFSLQGTVEQLLLFFHKLDDDKIELNNAEGLTGNATTYPDGFTYNPNTGSPNAGEFYLGFTKSNGKPGSQQYQIVASVGGDTVEQNMEKYRELDLKFRTEYISYLLNLGVNPADITKVSLALRDPTRLYIRK